MIKEASARNVGVAISSNMNIASDTLTEDILDCGLELLVFSCHGTTSETVQKFMGNSADVQLAMNNVENLVKERNRRKQRFPAIQWQYCVTGFNEHQMDEARATANRLGIDAIRFIKPWFPPHAGDEWYTSLFPGRSFTRSPIMLMAIQRSLHKPGRRHSSMLPGGLFPVNDFGNLLNEDFQSIWNGDRYIQSRKYPQCC